MKSLRLELVYHGQLGLFSSLDESFTELLHGTENMLSVLKCKQLNLPNTTVKILKIGTPEIITIIVLQLEQLDFTVPYCVQKMQTE